MPIHTFGIKVKIGNIISVFVKNMLADSFVIALTDLVCVLRKITQMAKNI
jgi:hypothetical protein